MKFFRKYNIYLKKNAMMSRPSVSLEVFKRSWKYNIFPIVQKINKRFLIIFRFTFQITKFNKHFQYKTRVSLIFKPWALSANFFWRCNVITSLFRFPQIRSHLFMQNKEFSMYTPTRALDLYKNIHSLGCVNLSGS